MSTLIRVTFLFAGAFTISTSETNEKKGAALCAVYKYTSLCG